VGDAFMRGALDPSKGIIFNAYPGLTTVSQTGGTNGTTAVVRETTTDYGPWAQVSNSGFLSTEFVPPGPPGLGGPVTGVSGQQAAGGGGGGGGGVIIIQARNLVLQSGYAIHANGGDAGDGFSSNGTTAVAQGGMGGYGGIIIIVAETITGSTSSITADAGLKGTGAGTSVATALDGIAGGVYIYRV
jgi:hypothetical protein